MRGTLGFDIGGTKLLAVFSPEQGEVSPQQRWPTGHDLSPAEGLRIMTSAIETFRQRGVTIDAVGIGFPGLVNHRDGRISSSVILPRWKGFELSSAASALFGISTHVDNDVNCAAIAESHERRLAVGDDMLFASVGTGVGGALVLDGRLWRGSSGLAGEIGHMKIARGGLRCMCGRRGCSNVFASGASVERRLGLKPDSLCVALASDPATLPRAVANAADAIGIAISNALNLLNLSLVVLGGGLAQLGGKYLRAVRRAVDRETFPEIAGGCRIELSRAGYSAGAVGAALLATDGFHHKT